MKCLVIGSPMRPFPILDAIERGAARQERLAQRIESGFLADNPLGWLLDRAWEFWQEGAR